MISALDAIKLALGLAAFVFIVAVGSRNKRVAGVLLTFPVMNGVALLTSPDPFRVADAIALLVVFNTLLFWAAVMTLRWVPPQPERWRPLALLICRVLVWTAVWCAAAYWLTDNRDRFPSAMILFALQLAFAVGAASLLWGQPPRPEQKTSTPTSLSDWLNWTVRIVLFLVIYAALLYTAQHASDQKWTGMASALPIIGFFGLAYLSSQDTEAQLQPIRDTILLGPLLVIPFNWSLASVITATPGGPLGAFHIAELLAAWAIALALVFALVPAIANFMDRRAG
jgi:hypothetical protein